MQLSPSPMGSEAVFRKTVSESELGYRMPWDSPVALAMKSLPAMQEMWESWVGSLGWEDPLEKEMATNSSNFAWRILWTKEPGGL